MQLSYKRCFKFVLVNSSHITHSHRRTLSCYLIGVHTCYLIGVHLFRENISKNITQKANIHKKLNGTKPIYKLTPEDEQALSFSLGDHITVNQRDIKIKTEFGTFYYNILKHANHLDQRKQDELKRRIYRSSENCSEINAPYKYQ